MKFINNKILVAGLAFSLGMVSCESDLDRFPKNEVTSKTIYDNFDNYKGVLAKAYAGLAVVGQNGGDGAADIGGIDGGTSNYLRQYFQLQEIPTDEVVNAWGDAGIPELNSMLWGASNQFVMAMYYRIFYQITLANEFIRETTDDKLSSRNISGTNAEEAKLFHNEARFLRALSYWHAIDLFGNVPFVTEKDPTGTIPTQISRAELFNYIESELKDLETLLKDPKTNEYGRADKAAVWMLLAKLYLNAEVYTGKAKYAEARTYAEKVINAGYSLNPKFENLFLADNHLAKDEIIFSINFDGINTRTYGGTTYIIRSGIGGSMNNKDFGVDGGWGGNRTPKQFVALFPSKDGSKDIRGRFHTDGQEEEINSMKAFTEGFPYIKFKNITSTGEQGNDVSGGFTDTDFPMFRLADAYLMYAEAVLRGGGGDKNTALNYVNAIRKRAKASEITVNDLNLNFILDERGRELAWEATRRTDLIRFGKFVSENYTWAFKGGVKDGKGVETFRNLYPIPSNDLNANPNLKQNEGY